MCVTHSLKYDINKRWFANQENSASAIYSKMPLIWLILTQRPALRHRSGLFSKERSQRQSLGKLTPKIISQQIRVSVFQLFPWWSLRFALPRCAWPVKLLVWLELSIQYPHIYAQGGKECSPFWFSLCILQTNSFLMQLHFALIKEPHTHGLIR